LAADLRRNPHYHTSQTLFKEIEAVLKALDGDDNRIIVLKRDGDHFHPQVTVINMLTENLSAIFENISLAEVNAIVRSKRIGLDCRGNIYIDFGYSGNTNKGRTKESFGNAVPRVRAIEPVLDSAEKITVNKCILSLSAIFSDPSNQYLIPGGLPISKLFQEPKGITKYSEKLVTSEELANSTVKNTFPAMRMAVSGRIYPVRIHCGWENPTGELHSIVPSYSEYVFVDGKWERSAYHSYGRDAILRAHSNIGSLEPYVLCIAEFYNTLPFDCRE
jgi:hypothetical protein